MGFYTALQNILKSKQNLFEFKMCMWIVNMWNLNSQDKEKGSCFNIKANTFKHPYIWILACFSSEWKTCTAKSFTYKCRARKKGMFTFIKRLEQYAVKSMPETNTLKTKNWIEHERHIAYICMYIQRIEQEIPIQSNTYVMRTDCIERNAQ